MLLWTLLHTSALACLPPLPFVGPVTELHEGGGIWSLRHETDATLILELDGVLVATTVVRSVPEAPPPFAARHELLEPDVPLREGQAYRITYGGFGDEVLEGTVGAPLQIAPPDIWGVTVGDAFEATGDCGGPVGLFRAVDVETFGEGGVLTLSDPDVGVDVATDVTTGFTALTYLREGRSKAPACVQPLWIHSDGTEVELDEVCAEPRGCSTAPSRPGLQVLLLLARR